MEETLFERAKKVAAMGNRNYGFTSAEFREIEEVYKLVIGHHKPCYECVVYRLISEISQKVIQQPLKLDPMATNHKFQFLPGKEATKPIRHMDGGTRIITSENLNKGDNGAWMAENYPHLIQEVKSESKEAEKPATKTEENTPKKGK